MTDLAVPCTTCEQTGRPAGVAPHDARQHLIMWATNERGARAGQPAWQLILSAVPPAGWLQDVPDVRNIDSVAHLAEAHGLRIVWRSHPRPA